MALGALLTNFGSTNDDGALQAGNGIKNTDRRLKTEMKFTCVLQNLYSNIKYASDMLWI